MDKRKKVQVISRSGDIEVVCATMYGKDGSFECPGGANGHKVFVRRSVIDDSFGRRIDKFVRRYQKLRRMGVAKHNIILAPLQDNSNK